MESEDFNFICHGISLPRGGKQARRRLRGKSDPAACRACGYDHRYSLAHLLHLLLLPFPLDVRRCIASFLRKPKYVKIAAGWNHEVYVLDNGRAVASGCNRDGQCDIPALPAGVYYVDAFAGCGFTVMLRDDGIAVLLGHCPFLTSHAFDGVPPSGTKYIAGTATLYHGVLLRDDGVAVSFGANYRRHRMQTAARGSADAPPLPEGLRYISAAAGYSHSIWLRSDGQALHSGIVPYDLTLPPLPHGRRYIRAAISGQMTHLLRDDGTVFCFGRRAEPSGYTYVPDKSDVRYTAVAAGESHMIALRSDGLVDTFGAYVRYATNGDDDDDEVNDNEEEMEYLTVVPPLLRQHVKIVDVSCGNQSTLFLLSNGEAVYRGFSPRTVPKLPVGLRLL